MRAPIKVDDFTRMNEQAFINIGIGKRAKAPRTKPRSRDEFIAIGKAVIAAIREAELEGRFNYDPEKGLVIKWKD